MKYVQTENIRDTRVAEGKFLRIGNRVQPRAPDQVRRNNVRRKLLKKTGAGADLDRRSARFPEREQPREKLLAVNAPQNGLLLPHAAMPEKLLLSLRIDGHGMFLIVLTSPVQAA